MFRKLSYFALTALFLFGTVADPAMAAKKKKGPDRLVDSDEYKEDDFEKGIIEDYSDMVEGDGVEWVFIADGVSLSDYKIKIGKVKNKSDVSSKSMVSAVEENLEEAIEDRAAKGGKGTLTAESAIYWAERASEGKRWIPYAGGHLAQAGVGVEMVLRDSGGRIIAKIRHSGRQGNGIDEAAEEVADEIAGYIADN